MADPLNPRDEKSFLACDWSDGESFALMVQVKAINASQRGGGSVDTAFLSKSHLPPAGPFPLP